MMGFKKILGNDYTKAKLSALWLFVMLNYIYADILTLMDSDVLNDLMSGQMSQGFLLAAAILMEIPIAMIILSLSLKQSINRWANIIAGSIKTLAVIASLFVGTPALYYIFFATIELITTSYIVWTAWKWR